MCECGLARARDDVSQGESTKSLNWLLVVYQSKKDWWLVGLVLAAIGIPLVLGAAVLLSRSNAQLGWSLLLIGTVTGAVTLCLTYPLYYKITSSELIVRCGMVIRFHISLAAIDEVRPDRNPLSAPAWSLDRLRIDYRKNGKHGFVLISPEDKGAFMQELAATDTGLRMIRDRLVRERT